MTNGPNAAPTTPSISIYQNGDHVAGMLQQAYEQGLLRQSAADSSFGSMDSTTAGTRGNAGFDVDVKVPGVGGIGADLGLGRDEGRKLEGRHDQRNVVNYEYTEAYYLHFLRKFLKNEGLLREVNGVTDARKAQVGDIVEFSATFSANQVSSLLDIVTPGLVGQVAHFMSRNQDLDDFDKIDEVPASSYMDKVRAFAAVREARADELAQISSAVAGALRADFRSDATRDYYARVGSRNSITAVTICEAECFLVRDPDRLLDGRFTVLGKIASVVAEDVPVLARNKLLSRLSPEFVDEAVQGLQEAGRDGVEGLAATGKDLVEQAIDLGFDSRIAGPSFNVIPIAIFV